MIFSSFGQNREETIGEFYVNYCFNKLAKRFSVKFMAGDLSLELPGFTVSVEDSVTEEVTERTVKCESFAVAREIGFENMLDYQGVRCEDLAGAECPVEDEGGGRGGLKDVGDPMNAAVKIGCN